MSQYLFDSTILIDVLNGVSAAREETLTARTPSISIVSWIETMVGARTPRAEAGARRLLRRMQIIPLSEEVAEQAVEVRRERRLKLPDAIIWATAVVHGLTLVTRNTRDFPEDHPSIRVPYRL